MYIKCIQNVEYSVTKALMVKFLHLHVYIYIYIYIYMYTIYKYKRL